MPLIAHEVCLTQYNSLGIECTAARVAFPLSEGEVLDIYRETPDVRKVVLGRGSNILLSRRHYGPQYLFVSTRLMDEVRLRGEAIHAKAGATLSHVSWFALEKSLQGLEFLEDIPGTVGGAIIMNAGTYGRTISQIVDRITYLDCASLQIVEEEVRDGDFRTRGSRWEGGSEVILSCDFRGAAGDYQAILDQIQHIKKGRYQKQPRDYPNAGSVFKKPLVDGRELEVWRLIDEAGLRGFHRNDAWISEKHTGFIVNKGRATYEDIIAVVDEARLRVRERFGVQLELEWKVI